MSARCRRATTTGRRPTADASRGQKLRKRRIQLSIQCSRSASVKKVAGIRPFQDLPDLWFAEIQEMQEFAVVRFVLVRCALVLHLEDLGGEADLRHRRSPRGLVQGDAELLLDPVGAQDHQTVAVGADDVTGNRVVAMERGVAIGVREPGDQDVDAHTFAKLGREVCLEQAVRVAGMVQRTTASPESAAIRPGPPRSARSFPRHRVGLRQVAGKYPTPIAAQGSARGRKASQASSLPA